MGLRRPVNFFHHALGVKPPKNDSVAALTFSRKGSDDNLQWGVAPEYYWKRLVENGAGTYPADFLIPAGALITDIVVIGEALWDAATSASLEVGDFQTDGTTEIDDDGFFTAVDLKATDLLAGQALGFHSLGAEAGAYRVGTSTHWTALYSSSARIVRFNAVSVGAGTAGRTWVGVAFVQPAEAYDTVTQ